MDLALFENHSVKIVGILYSLIVTSLSISIFLSIISYEHNHYRYRTLINQLLTKLAKIVLFANILVQLPTTLLYIFGPLPWYICYPQAILSPILTAALVLLTNAITVVRYLFIFCVKNPTSVQDDFWAEFINMWALLASFLGNLVFFLLPGKNPHRLYICMGSAPSDYSNLPSKMNIFLMGLFLVSIIIQIFVHVKQKLYNNNEVRSIRENDNSQLDLATFLFTFFFITTVALFSSISIILNMFALQDLMQYPNYLLFYVLHLIIAPTFNILIICFLFQKDKKMKRYVRNELVEKILFWGRKLNLVEDPVFAVNS